MRKCHVTEKLDMIPFGLIDSQLLVSLKLCGCWVTSPQFTTSSDKSEQVLD